MARTEEYRDGPLADKEKVRKKGLDERLARRTALSDIHTILSQRVGRRFIWRLLTAGRIFAPTFTGNNTSFFNEGKREVMLEFLADTQEFPELYLLMVKESREPVEKEKEDGPRMMETVPRDDQGAD